MPRDNAHRRPDPIDGSDTELESEDEIGIALSHSEDSTPATMLPEPSQDTLPVPTRRSARVASRPVAVEPVEPAAKKSSRKVNKGKEITKNDVNISQLESGMKKIKLDPKPKRVPKPKPVHQHTGEYFNALLRLADLQYCSGSQLFVWGAGNAGQFGMGVKHTGEFNRPTKNTLVEKMMADGKFGKKSAGIVALAAGGMSSLFVDETGTVRSQNAQSAR